MAFSSRGRVHSGGGGDGEWGGEVGGGMAAGSHSRKLKDHIFSDKHKAERRREKAGSGTRL